MGEEINGTNRRKEDLQFAKFMGEIDQWKKDSNSWREQTDKTLKEIRGFMDEVRTPRKIIIWTIRAFFVSAIGSLIAALTAFVKGHITIK